METFSMLLALYAENSATNEFPTQRPVTRSFDVLFDLRPNKRLSKQSRGWWFETPSCSLRRHCNERYPIIQPCRQPMGVSSVSDWGKTEWYDGRELNELMFQMSHSFTEKTYPKIWLLTETAGQGLPPFYCTRGNEMQHRIELYNAKHRIQLSKYAWPIGLYFHHLS